VEEETMKVCICAAATTTPTNAAPPYIDSALAPMRQPGRSQGLYPVFREHPAAAAA
jgi:hypothetical protein